MKNIEIEILYKVLSVMKEKLPKETELIQEFKTAIDGMVGRNNRRNQSYLDKADYYKTAVREWEKKNPEKKKEYSRRYQEKKKRVRMEKIANLSSQGKTETEIAEELKISEKTVLLCLEEIIY